MTLRGTQPEHKEIWIKNIYKITLNFCYEKKSEY